MRSSIESRKRSLRTANYNVALVPAADVPIDLSGHPCRDNPGSTNTSSELAYEKLTQAVDSVLGCTFCLPVHLGRGAEMAIASMISPGEEVLCNEVYLTGQWSIRQHGGNLCSLLDTEDTKFSGNLDLDLLANRLSTRDPGGCHPLRKTPHGRCPQRRSQQEPGQQALPADQLLDRHPSKSRRTRSGRCYSRSRQRPPYPRFRF